VNRAAFVGSIEDASRRESSVADGFSIAFITGGNGHG
jgi:hypothetical protein